MTILKIHTYPDPVLREVAKPVDIFDKELHVLLDDLGKTMYHEDRGVGLAAPQVGVSKRIFVADVSEDRSGLIEFVNPSVKTEGDIIPWKEGCLSIPGYYDTVKRNARVVVTAQDRNGKEFTMEGDQLFARCVLHELDHLDGILFIDHLSRLKREMFQRWLKKQKQ